jgi:amino acid adenylation domain-containing protein
MADELGNHPTHRHPLLGKTIRKGIGLYLLDKFFMPLPNGVVGELFIGGSVLSDGYFKLPAKTGEQFLPDRFNKVAGSRMYRTGDLAFKEQTGNFIFFGRSDNQIKIGGIRIELKAIERVISNGFNDVPCTVIPVDNNHSLNLALYIQCVKFPGAIDKAREILLNVQGGQFISAINFCQLPLTERGKVDIKKLQKFSLQKSPEAPDSKSEVVKLIEKILGLQNVKRSDSFFDLGAHSLSVLQLIADVRRTLGVKLNVRDIYKAKQVGRLEKLVQETKKNGIGFNNNKEINPWKLSEFEIAIQLDEIRWSGSSPYSITDEWQLSAPIPDDRLKKAIGVMLMRHPILRASPPKDAYTFIWQDQGIEEALTNIINPDASSLLKVYQKSKEDTYILVISAHHSLLDGACLEVFLKELQQAYNHSLKANKPAKVNPPLAPSTKDYYNEWHEKLQEISNAALSVKLNQAKTINSKAVCVKKSSNLRIDFLHKDEPIKNNFASCLGLILSWLHRLKESADLLIGIASSHLAEVDGLRMTTSRVPVRSQINSKSTYGTIKNAMAQEILWILEHSLIDPMLLTKVLRESTNQLSEIPFLFDYQDLRSEAVLNFDGIQGTLIPTEPKTTRADLEVKVTIQKDQSIQFSLLGNANIYARDTLNHWIESLTYFAETIAYSPDQSIWEIPIINPGHSSAAVCFNPVLEPFNEAASLPDLLINALLEKGKKKAIISPEDTWSGLDTLNKMEELLKVFYDANIHKGDCIIVELPRHPLYVPAIIAIWNFGLIPVLINPNQPKSRKKLMYLQVKANWVLRINNKTDNCTLEKIKHDTSDKKHISGWSKTSYVIFTSGSTGVPKAVACSWMGLHRLLHWSKETLPLKHGDAFLHTATTGFDISVWEMLYPILTPAPLLVASQEGIGDMEKLIEFAEKNRATHMHLIPGLLKSYLDALRIGEGAYLKLILSGGESTPVSLQRRVFEKLQIPLRHCYGPTECSIFVLSWSGSESLPGEIKKIPLGTPINGSGIAILDQSRQPVVKGMIGEIGIFGDALAHGYIGRASETAEKFYPWIENGSRIYLSGDKARMDEDGTIEYMGRVDRQIKIAGLRIEPGEIEAVLNETKGVSNSLVLNHLDENKKTNLTAYLEISTHIDQEKTKEDALNRIKQFFPIAAHPKLWVLLHKFPTNINGKVDIKKLPTPKKETLEAGSNTSVSDSPIQEKMAALWKNTLQIKNLGPEDSFFMLGGDSITAIRITALARNIGVYISLADFFKWPTFNSFVTAVENRNSDNTKTEKLSVGTKLVLGDAAIRWLNANRQIEGKGIQSLLLRSKIPIKPNSLLISLNSLLSRHHALSMCVRKVHGQWQALMGKVQLRKQIFKSPGAREALQDAKNQISPKEGIMMGVCLVENDPNAITIAIHHLAIDIQSWEILLFELEQVYQTTDPESLRSITIPFWKWGLLKPKNETIGSTIHYTQENNSNVFIQSLKTSAIVTNFIYNTKNKRNAILIEAIVKAYAKSFNKALVNLELEHDGRYEYPEIDTSLTVGWLTGYKQLQIQFPLTNGNSVFEVLKNQKGTIAKNMPVDLAVNIVAYPNEPSNKFFSKTYEDFDISPAHALAVEVAMSPEEIKICVNHDNSFSKQTANKFLEFINSELEIKSQGYIEKIPLSPLQSSIFATYLRNPGSSLYNTQIIFKIPEKANLEVLKLAWEHVFKVYDCFHCMFDVYDTEGPCLSIVSKPVFQWRQITDLSVSSEFLLDKFIVQDNDKPFLLEKGDVSRWYLLEGANGTHLIWSHHHIILDGWSLNLIISFFGETYNAIIQKDNLPTPSGSILTMAAWWEMQNNTTSVKKWVNRLKELRPKALIPKIDSENKISAVDAFELDQKQSSLIHTLSNKYSVTGFEMILAAWSLVLASQTRAKDVLFGIVMSVRPPEITESEKIAGFCINTVPFSVSVSGTLEELMSNIRNVHLDLINDRQLSLFQVFGALKKENWNNQIDSLVVFENYPGDKSGITLDTHGKMEVLKANEKNETPFTLIVFSDKCFKFELLYQGNEAQRYLSKRLINRLKGVLDSLVKNI